MSAVDEIEIAGCPKCGERPEVSNAGSCIDFECCWSMSWQKCDLVELEERFSWPNILECEGYRYPDEIENKLIRLCADDWNDRSIEDALNQRIAELEAKLAEANRCLAHENEQYEKLWSVAEGFIGWCEECENFVENEQFSVDGNCCFGCLNDRGDDANG